MYEVFEQLLQKFGITAADVCKATGIYIIIPLTFPILQAFPPVH